MQAIGIVRVSTTEQAQEERYSIPHQRAHIAEECQRRGLDLVHIFEFVQSGAKVLASSGQERQKILEYIKEYGVGVVVVHELDRLARSMLDTLLFVDELNRLGVAFISVHDGFDTTTAQGQLQMHILSAFSEYFRKQLASKVMGGMAERARQGKPLGKIPYGYTMGESGYVIDPEPAKIVELIFRWYLEENQGMRGIASRLNSMGVKTKKGNQWSHVTIRDILENEAYTGTFVWNNIRVENAHPPIIDKETFELAKKRRKRKKALGGQAHNEKYLLSGLVRCGKCGGAITGHIQRKGQYSYKYYTCQNYISKGTSVCSGGFLNSAKLEAAVLSDIDSLLNGTSASIRRELIPTDVEHLAEELKLKEKELERNKTMLRRAAEAYEAGEYDLDFFSSRKATLSMQKKQIEHEMQLIKQRIENRLSSEELAQQLAEKLKAAGSILKETDMAKAKARLQGIIDHIEVRAIDDITIYYRV